MIIDQVNLNHLRIFESVYRSRSMTLAAKDLHLTQSGVSQHIKTLEAGLGLLLFDRLAQRLVPTRSADLLFEKCTVGLYAIEQALLELKGEAGRLKGDVRVGMPIEFGNNVLMPRLAEICKQHPQVRFEIRLGFAIQMNEMLLNGALDFAFVDEFVMDRRIKTQRVGKEILQLCMTEGSWTAIGRPENKKTFESLEYVDYQQGEPLLRMWFKHHLSAQNLALNCRAHVMDVQAVANLILAGGLVGVLPDHVVDAVTERRGKVLHLFKGCGKPLANHISVAFLAERTQSPVVQAVLKGLMARQL